MSLRKKILIILIVSLGVSFISLSLVSRYLLYHSYEDLEQKRTRKNLSLILSILYKQAQEIQTLTEIWSQWEGVDLIADAQYNKLPLEKFSKAIWNLKLNFIAIIDKDGKPLYLRINEPTQASKMYYPSEHILRILSVLYSRYGPGDADNTTNTHSDNILTIVKCPMFIGSQYIQSLKRPFQAPNKLVFGRCIDFNEIKNLAASMNVGLEIVVLNRENRGFYTSIIKRIEESKDEILVHKKNDKIIEGYALLRDLYNRPAIIVKSYEQRIIFNYGKRITFIFQNFLIFIGLLIGLFTIWIFDRHIFSHIYRLKETVTQITKNRNLNVRVPETGPAELKELSKSFNEMIESLAHYQNEMIKIQHSLEEKVRERTKELEKAYTQLLHAEKLSCLGKLSANIAHEFGNPLFGIRNVLVHLKDSQGSGVENREIIELGLQECQRIKGLLDRLKDLSKPTTEQVTEIDINRLIDEMLILFKKEFKEHRITVEEDFDPTYPKIVGISDQIKQVIINILKNAQEAIPESGGLIKISTRDDGDHVTIVIQDSGVGIEPEDLNRIFEPFFTTKEKEGTGLGLSTSYMIIKKHGGEIRIESTKDRGTTVTITLPKHNPLEMQPNAQETISSSGDLL